MNPVLMKALVDVAAFFSLSDDDVVNPDAAVGQLEHLASALKSLGPEDRRVLIKFVDSMRSNEEGTSSTERLEFLSTLPENLGLV